jgi:hypothetical protein
MTAMSRDTKFTFLNGALNGALTTHPSFENALHIRSESDRICLGEMLHRTRRICPMAEMGHDEPSWLARRHGRTPSTTRHNHCDAVDFSVVHNSRPERLQQDPLTDWIIRSRSSRSVVPPEPSRLLRCRGGRSCASAVSKCNRWTKPQREACALECASSSSGFRGPHPDAAHHARAVERNLRRHGCHAGGLSILAPRRKGASWRQRGEIDR